MGNLSAIFRGGKGGIVSIFNPIRLHLCFFSSFLMKFCFFGEVGGDEELGDFLFLGGEGAEVGNALELLGGESGLWRLFGRMR